MCTPDTTSSTGSEATGARAWWNSSRAAGPSHAPLTVTSHAEIAHQLADACGAIYVGNDLEQVIRRRERRQDRLVIERAMLVAHAGDSDRHPPILEHAQ